VKSKLLENWLLFIVRITPQEFDTKIKKKMKIVGGDSFLVFFCGA
jgi:hypothetical protein